MSVRPPQLLAYVFWHWKRPEVPLSQYEQQQLAFQAALDADRPAGFREGSTFRLRGAAWAASGGSAYEDWYLVEDMAALERLNGAAVTASRQQPHDAVASLAAGGIAGLYGLRAGAPLHGSRQAAWFAKPAGMSYATLDELLRPALERGSGALWSRRMTLGPAPEFCLHSPGGFDPPPGISPQHFQLELLSAGAS